jgi:outer membrane protein OmpA-like peptidoglycan-associated protein
MKWNFAAGLVTAIFVAMHAAPPADACGVKLTVKSSAPRKAVARTSNPSDILLLGNPPRRLESDLSAAGHRVDVSPTASAAKRKPYAVVIADASLTDEARSNFPDAVVIVRSGDVTADMRTVEQQVGRKPVRTEAARSAVAVRPTRTPLAAGPPQDPNRRIVAASEPKETPEPTPAPSPPPATERVTTSTAKVESPRAEPKATDVAPTPAPDPRSRAVVRPGAIHHEVYFGLGSFRVDPRSLAQDVKWLTTNKDVHVVIEGHADPSGSHEGNMALGEKRAELVRDTLVSAGIEESRLEVISYGDTRLRYGRPDGRNRRAAIVVK